MRPDAPVANGSARSPASDVPPLRNAVGESSNRTAYQYFPAGKYWYAVRFEDSPTAFRSGGTSLAGDLALPFATGASGRIYPSLTVASGTSVRVEAKLRAVRRVDILLSPDVKFRMN